MTAILALVIRAVMLIGLGWLIHYFCSVEWLLGICLVSVIDNEIAGLVERLGKK